MGIAKNQMMEQDARGYGSIDKSVCADCVGDYALKQFITENGVDGTCDYCYKEGICVNVESLLGKIMNGILFEYEEAIGCMGIEDGEYIGANTYDTYELLYYELVDDMELNNKLLDDVFQTVKDTTWCERDPYQLRKGAEKSYMWANFSQMVKTKTRFVFFRMPEQDDYQEEADFLILDKIGDDIGSLGLIKHLASGAKFIRGRMHTKETRIECDRDLCSPPHEKAKSNRMSAEGISIFYGADSEETAITEIYDPRKMFATTAVFQNLNDIQVIDLSKIDDNLYYSMFDEEKRCYRESLAFLKELNRSLTCPIESMESIEYIPAQIFAEYFRFLYTYEDMPIDGIVYRSSKVKNGICYALFFDHDQCLDSTSKNLFGFSNKQMLKMDATCICTHKVNIGIKTVRV